MIIFGVDPGTKYTGYGIIKYEENNAVYIDSGVIIIPPADEITPKIKLIYAELDRLMKIYKPDEFAIETEFYSKNIQSALKIGYARGVSLLAAINNSVNTNEYSPREVKKSVTGRGSASKEQVQYMIKHLLKLDSSMPLDESDALAIALCHSFKMKSFSRKSSSWKDYINANPHKVKG